MNADIFKTSKWGHVDLKFPYEAIEDIALPTKVEIAFEQMADATLHQFYNGIREWYCVIMIGNTELLIYAKLFAFF